MYSDIFTYGTRSFSTVGLALSCNWLMVMFVYLSATDCYLEFCSERKQKISEVLNRVKVDIVAGQETWERKDKVVDVDGYKWFGKPRIDQNSRRGEGGVGFLVCECIAEEVEFIRDVRYKESVWMKVRGGRGKEALYLCCVYMPTEGSAAAVIEDGYGRMYLSINRREG